LNIFLKSIIILTLFFSPTICNADNFDKLLKKELSYHKIRQTVSGLMIAYGFNKEKYTKRITESKNKLDTLNKIDSKDKSKILEQITKNVGERAEVVNNEIKDYQNKIKSTKDKMKKFPSVTPTYLKLIKSYSNSIETRKKTIKSLNENQKDLEATKKRINASKTKGKATATIKTTRTSTLNKFKKFLKTKKTTPPVTPKTTSTSNIDRFRKFLKDKEKTKTSNLGQKISDTAKQNKKATVPVKAIDLSTISKKYTPKVAKETPRKKKKGITVKPIAMPLPPKKPPIALKPPPKITPPKPKPAIATKSDGKTVLKNVNILTTSKTGNIDTKGKLSIANVKVAKGTTLKNTNIDANVKVKNISVSKGSSADIGSVKIEN